MATKRVSARWLTKNYNGEFMSILKRATVLISLIAFPLMAQAIVVDKFNCELNIENAAAKIATHQETELMALRLPVLQSPAPDVKITGSSLSFSLALMGPNRDFFREDIHVSYLHAVKIDGNNVPYQAKRTSCSGTVSSTCDPRVENCGSPRFICEFDKGNPWSEDSRWSEVALPNGIPDASGLGINVEAEFSSKLGAKILVKGLCRHVGTYE